MSSLACYEMTEISSSLIEVLRGYNSGFFVEPFFSSSSTKRAVFAPYSKADCFCDDSSSLWAVSFIGFLDNTVSLFRGKFTCEMF